MIKYGLTFLSVSMLGFTIFHVSTNQEQWQTANPPAPPPRSPFAYSVASAGMVEAQNENISIGSPVPGVVTEVFVQVGEQVKGNAPLFRLDDRAVQAELKVRQAQLAAAQADLTRLESEPRQELLPAKEALVREAQASLAHHEYEYQRVQSLYEEGNAKETEFVQKQNGYHIAQAKLAQVRAELELMKAGAWTADKRVAQAAVAHAQAQVEQITIELDRLTVRSRVDGQVLQVNVRPGEFVATPSPHPLIVLGDLQRLHVRADIDEYDIPRFKSGAPAKAMIKGQPEEAFDLSFVRIEPFVIPKKSLTGATAERVDTRVLQVIYAIEPTDKQIYVGQQLDVYFDLGPPPAAITQKNPALPSTP